MSGARLISLRSSEIRYRAFSASVTTLSFHGTPSRRTFRYQTIGRVTLGILFVVYTPRVYDEGKLVHRIISARPAKAKEIQLYEARTFGGKALP